VCTKNLVYIWYSIGSRAGVWGGSQIGGRQEGLHLLKFVCDNRWV